MNLDTDNPAEFVRWFTHRLGVAIRFIDVFTGEVIRVPLQVSAPAQNWQAVRRAQDATYRFVFSEVSVPTGSFDIDVEAPGGEYLNWIPIEVTLPIVPATSPITVGDYLMELPLWPTRRVRPPDGETAVIGRLVSATANPVSNLDIRLFRQGDPAPAMPFARSDGMGAFLFRLPWFQWQTPPLPNVEIRVTESGGTILPVNPSSFALEPGRLQSRSFEIP
jgi:hypothetical protein